MSKNVVKFEHTRDVLIKIKKKPKKNNVTNEMLLLLIEIYTLKG